MLRSIRNLGMVQKRNNVLYNYTGEWGGVKGGLREIGLSEIVGQIANLSGQFGELPYVAISPGLWLF